MSSIPTAIGRYQIVSPIARGGMGTLYRAWDPKLDRHVAIKLLNEDNEELRQRFAREARSVARLRHPHIVTVFDVGEDAGRPFLAMEFVQGKTFSELIRARAALVTRRKLEMIEELCDGLAYAHKSGIVHRDVKPANVMVDANEEIKILDFGIARVAESTGVTRAGTLIGSLNYMSPEQISGRPVDHRSDIFSVGSVLYELLAYRVAFPGAIDDGLLHRLLYTEPEPLGVVCREIDPEVSRIVARCLEKNPEQRYPDLDAMVRDLQRIRSRMPSTDDSTTHIDEPREVPAVARHTPTPTPDSSRRSVDKEELSRRRSSQILTFLENAQTALASGDFEAAIAACEEILLRDAEHGRALELLDRARAGLDERQAEEWLAQAEREIRRGALTAALTLIERARALSPDSMHANELQRMADEAMRERERTRQRAEAIRQTLDRAHELFDKGLFREADQATDEVLALEPDSADASRLKARAAEAIATQQRTELERRAREAVREARRLTGLGNYDGAIELMSQFEAEHPLVKQTLEQIRAEAARIAEQRRVDAERRARQQRVDAALLVVRTEMKEQQFASALQRLEALVAEEGSAPEIEALVREAEAAQAELDRIAEIAREVSEHVARAAGLLARQDLSGARSRVESALALDPQNAAALSLRAKVDERLRADAERREAEQRRARERESTIAAALARAEKTGSHEAAIAIINDILAGDPDHGEARRQLERHKTALATEQAERRRLADEQRARRQRVEQLLTTARQALQKDDFPAAERSVKSALELEPQNADAQFLADDVATAKVERARKVEAAPVTAPAPRIQNAVADKADAKAKSQARAPRPSQKKIFVLAGSSLALASVVAIVLLTRNASQTPPATVASGPTTASPPATSPAAPAPTAAAEPPGASAPTVPADQVGPLIAQARQEMTRGDWQRALATAASAARLRAGDPEVAKLLESLWQDSLNRMTAERTTATGVRGTSGSAGYRNAARREQEANRLHRAGQLEGATRAAREAADLFRQAGIDAAAATPRTGSAPTVASPPPAAPGSGRSEAATTAPPTTRPEPTEGQGTGPAPAATQPVAPNTSTTANPAPASVPGPQSTTPPPTPAPVQPSASSQPQPSATPPAQRGGSPPPPRPVVSDDTLIKSVLDAYAAAYGRLDVAAVKRLHPAVNEQDLARRFADLRSQQVQITGEQVSVSGNTATVACTVTTTFQGQVGGSRRVSQPTTFHLEKQNGAWLIVSRQ